MPPVTDMTLRVYNTAARDKVDFVPLEPGKVGMYVCGVTVYDYCHVGHARVYVAFDVIQRWLRRHYDVTYVRNFTDVDDKIIKRANENGEPPQELADRFIDAFHEDMAALGVHKADIEPKVSEHIQGIIDFVSALEEGGFAYRVPSDSDVEGAGDDVFFRVRMHDTYTALSGHNLDDEHARARVEGDPRKEDRHDFALWKSAKPGEPFWDSPFGKGRPGWHIECSVMSAAHLGETLDIHGGGKDLVFPHHTNEIAQSECKHGKPYANYWMHNGFVAVEAEDDAEEHCEQVECEDGTVVKVQKMSKSLGNFFSIREVLTQYSPEALRWFLITTHYRAPINYGKRHLEAAELRIQYLYNTKKSIAAYLAQFEPREGDDAKTVFSTKERAFDPLAEFAAAMDDDFATGRAIVPVQEVLRLANLLCGAREKEVIGRKLKAADRARVLTELDAMLTDMLSVLGVGEADPESYLKSQRTLMAAARGICVDTVEAKIQARIDARAAKDFAASDAIRDELAAMGVAVRDTAHGMEWSVGTEG